MIDKIIIRTKWLQIMHLLEKTFRVMSAISWNFPWSSGNIDLPQLDAFLIRFEQQSNLIRIQNPIQTTALDPDDYGLWVQSLQSKCESRTPDAASIKHSSCKNKVTVCISKQVTGIFIFRYFISAMTESRKIQCIEDVLYLAFVMMNIADRQASLLSRFFEFEMTTVLSFSPIIWKPIKQSTEFVMG